MKAKYQSLRDFGYSFLGPMMGMFLNRLYEGNSSTTPVCLAREGWAFEYVINRAKNDGFFRNLPSPIYLKVSRSLLFRILAGNVDRWQYFLGRSPFSGTVTNFLINRFGMTWEEVQERLPAKVGSTVINLPDDAAALEEILTPYALMLMKYVQPTADAFERYVDIMGLTDINKDFTFLDVGYSGTIQVLLTSILKRDTRGRYFITCVPSECKVGRYEATIEGTFLRNVKWGDNHIMLERSLLIESLLTAPHGQVRDIRLRQDGDFEFFYGRPAESQLNFQDLLAVFEGAGDCVIDMLRNQILYSDSEITSIFSAFAKPYSAIPTDASLLFHVDDEFSGNGLLWPTQLFGL